MPFKSTVGDYQTVATLETFGFLPPFTQDEIYDQMTYDDAEFTPMATLVHQTLCGTLSGLSKVYRACGYRVGWAVFSGDVTALEERYGDGAPQLVRHVLSMPEGEGPEAWVQDGPIPSQLILGRAQPLRKAA